MRHMRGHDARDLPAISLFHCISFSLCFFYFMRNFFVAFSLHISYLLWRCLIPNWHRVNIINKWLKSRNCDTLSYNYIELFGIREPLRSLLRNVGRVHRYGNQGKLSVATRECWNIHASRYHSSQSLPRCF